MLILIAGLCLQASSEEWLIRAEIQGSKHHYIWVDQGGRMQVAQPIFFSSRPSEIQLQQQELDTLTHIVNSLPHEEYNRASNNQCMGGVSIIIFIESSEIDFEIGKNFSGITTCLEHPVDQAWSDLGNFFIRQLYRDETDSN